MRGVASYEVIDDGGDGAAEDVETFQGLDWAVHRAWSGRQRDLVYSLLTLDGLGQGDGDDDALVDLPDLAPREVAYNVGSSRMAGEQVAAAQHGEEQEQGRVLEHLEGGNLTPGGLGRRSGVEEVGQDDRSNRETPTRRAWEHSGCSPDHRLEVVELRRAGNPMTETSSVYTEGGQVLPEAI